MKRLLILSALLVGGAVAGSSEPEPYTPDVDFVEVCHDGEFRALVVQAMKPGIYILRFPADLCKMGDA